MLKGVDLVIFDFDGVIVDSEVISLTTLREALAESGLKMTAQDVRQEFLGRSLSAINAFLDSRGLKSDTFSARWEKKLFSQLKATLKPIPGVKQLLNALLAQGVNHCVASSASFTRINLAMEATQLQHLFPSVFSAEQVENGKPAPDLFLHAAANQGVSPARCLVIEDSAFGIRAARAAKMRAIGFLGGSHLKDLRDSHGATLRALGAEKTISSYAQIMPNGAL